MCGRLIFKGNTPLSSNCLFLITNAGKFIAWKQNILITFFFPLTNRQRVVLERLRCYPIRLTKNKNKSIPVSGIRFYKTRKCDAKVVNLSVGSDKNIINFIKYKLQKNKIFPQLQYPSYHVRAYKNNIN